MNLITWCTPLFWRAICVEHRTLASPDRCVLWHHPPCILYVVILHAEFLATTLPLPDPLGLIYPPSPPSGSGAPSDALMSLPVLPVVLPSLSCFILHGSEGSAWARTLGVHLCSTYGCSDGLWLVG